VDLVESDGRPPSRWLIARYKRRVAKRGRRGISTHTASSDALSAMDRDPAEHYVPPLRVIPLDMADEGEAGGDLIDFHKQCKVE